MFPEAEQLDNWIALATAGTSHGLQKYAIEPMAAILLGLSAAGSVPQQR